MVRVISGLRYTHITSIRLGCSQTVLYVQMILVGATVVLLAYRRITPFEKPEVLQRHKVLTA